MLLLQVVYFGQVAAQVDILDVQSCYVPCQVLVAKNLTKEKAVALRNELVEEFKLSQKVAGKKVQIRLGTQHRPKWDYVIIHLHTPTSYL